MCKWGTHEIVEVTIPADLSHTGEARRKRVGIDACIASIVRALDKAKIGTRYACCGHGKTPGEIRLEDGRRLIIATGLEATRWPPRLPEDTPTEDE